MTDLQTTFQETGTQLDRIIDAFKRKDPNWPRYAAFVYDGDIPTCYKIDKDLNTSCINGYSGESDISCVVDEQDSNIVAVADYWNSDAMGGGEPEAYPIFSFDRETFELFSGGSDSAYLQWLDLSSFTTLYLQDSSIRKVGIVGKFTDRYNLYASGYYYSNIVKIEIGDTVTELLGNSLDGYTNLSSIVIPNSVTSISYRGTFGRGIVPKLSSVTFLGRTMAQVQGMSDYPWSYRNGTIHCEDGDIAL